MRSKEQPGTWTEWTEPKLTIWMEQNWTGKQTNTSRRTQT